MKHRIHAFIFIVFMGDVYKRQLEAFLTHGANPVKKEELLTALWGTTEYIDENALQVNLTRLKKTMQELEMCLKIIPVRGIGYQLISEGNKDE